MRTADGKCAVRPSAFRWMYSERMADVFHCASAAIAIYQRSGDRSMVNATWNTDRQGETGSIG